MPNNKSLQHAQAANTRWGAVPSSERAAHTAPGRRAFHNRFLEQANGDARQAENLRKAHMQRLALRSAKARAARKRGDLDGAA